ncbi:MAG TPA: calcium/sodium antiporter [Nitrosopumilaceae archaeon]|jgi:cation:H+ antiporter|nr:calcium/sodium antiporter [Nitrosopumilaceae archaeon]
MDIAINVVLTAVGLAMLCFGGNWLVNGGVIIAKKLRISNLIIGMTVVAYGTSTPELAATIAAAGDHSGIILGNIIGSNIANIGLVIGIAAIMVPLVIRRETMRKEISIMLGVSFLLVVLSLDGELSQYDGILLIGSLVAFTIFTFRDAKKQRIENDENEIKNISKTNVYPKAVGLIGLGVTLLGAGAYLTVENSVVLAKEFGLSEKLIGLTVIAIGTSLPELITSVIAIRKGHTDIGVGNIIGSNIYNILMIMGVGAALGSVVIASDVFIDYAIMIAFSASLLVALKMGVISKVMGIILAIAYVIFLIATFVI